MKPTTKIVTITTMRWICEKGHNHRSEEAALRCQARTKAEDQPRGRRTGYGIKPTNEEYNLLAELMEQGVLKMEICRIMGKCYSSMNLYFGAMFGNYKPSRKKPNHERDCDMCDRYRSGEVLNTIGEAHGVTRERVRQILSSYGLCGLDGGQHVVALEKKLKRDLINNKRREKRAQERYGVDHATFAAIRKKEGSSMTNLYLSFKHQVVSGHNYNKGTKWDFTLKTYCDVWREAGHKVQEEDYYFSRIDTDGDFTADNVRIITAHAFHSRAGKNWGTYSDYQKQKEA